jgi:hypothetical protein
MQILNDEGADLVLSATLKGQPYTPTNTPSWTSSNPAVVTIVPSGDGLKAQALSVDGAVGSSTISVNVDGVVATLGIDVAAVPVAPPAPDAVSVSSADVFKKPVPNPAP